MRCRECNVDLGEEYTKCPLCGADASDDEPVLKGISTAEYPKEYKIEHKKQKKNYPQKYVLRAVILISAVLGILSAFTSVQLWVKVVPALMALTAFFYTVCGFFEKGKMLHSGIALLACFGTEVIFFVISVIAGCTLTYHVYAVLELAIMFILLGFIKHKRMGAQLRATFNL